MLRLVAEDPASLVDREQRLVLAPGRLSPRMGPRRRAGQTTVNGFRPLHALLRALTLPDDVQDRTDP